MKRKEPKEQKTVSAEIAKLGDTMPACSAHSAARKPCTCMQSTVMFSRFASLGFVSGVCFSKVPSLPGVLRPQDLWHMPGRLRAALEEGGRAHAQITGVTVQDVRKRTPPYA